MVPSMRPTPPSGTNLSQNWTLRRLKTVFRETQERTNREGTILPSLTRQRGLTPPNESAAKTLSAQDLSKYKVCQPGDIVMNRMQAGSGMFAVASRKGLVSPDYTVLKPIEECNIHYFGHLLKTPRLVRQFAEKSKGIGDGFNRLYTPDFGDCIAPFPPYSEQAAIVRYLDHADELISRYIGAKERLIALLEEQRQAVINQAVTRGLDPKVKLKPSSAHWLGNVPERWEMRRAKQLFNPRRELARPDDVQLSATQAYGVIPQDEYEQRVGRKVVKISLHLDKRHHVEVDDFVISMRSFQGGLERAWATGCIRSSYVVLHPTSEVNVDFFSYLFKSQAYIQALQSTANFIRDGQDLNFNNFCVVDLPVPPAAEQRETAMALGQATSNIDANIARTRHQIDLIIEYRIRLIADVVTGQIDVRNATVELPAEAR